MPAERSDWLSWLSAGLLAIVGALAVPLYFEHNRSELLEARYAALSESFKNLEAERHIAERWHDGVCYLPLGRLADHGWICHDSDDP
jgi:hypothetical protein